MARIGRLQKAIVMSPLQTNPYMLKRKEAQCIQALAALSMNREASSETFAERDDAELDALRLHFGSPRRSK